MATDRRTHRAQWLEILSEASFRASHVVFNGTKGQKPDGPRHYQNKSNQIKVAQV